MPGDVWGSQWSRNGPVRATRFRYDNLKELEEFYRQVQGSSNDLSIADSAAKKRLYSVFRSLFVACRGYLNFILSSHLNTLPSQCKHNCTEPS